MALHFFYRRPRLITRLMQQFSSLLKATGILVSLVSIFVAIIGFLGSADSDDAQLGRIACGVGAVALVVGLLIFALGHKLTP